tara:strand:- start:711 stop:1100 length:390 start_codon:yes stop_codon:yes gene_type:complete
VRGIISGFLFGCISLAVFSIIIGILVPKPPESFDLKAPDWSQFTNSKEEAFWKAEGQNQAKYSSYGITLPTTKRKLNPGNNIQINFLSVPMRPNSNFSTTLKIIHATVDGPKQPKILNMNEDNSVGIKN